MQNITGTAGFGYAVLRDPVIGAFGFESWVVADYAQHASGSQPSRKLTFDASRVARTSSETRGAATRTQPVILI